MKKNLLEEIDGYFMNLVYIKDLMQVYIDIDDSKIMNDKAPNFSLITQCALIDSYMICLMKLYDKSEKAKTIPNLIKRCEKNLHLFKSPDDVSNKIKEFENILKKDENVVNPIRIMRIRRDQYYAHNDKKYFGERFKDDKSYLPTYSIWFLINFTNEVLSYFWNQLCDEEYRKTKYNSDLINLFR